MYGEPQTTLLDPLQKHAEKVQRKMENFIYHFFERIPFFIARLSNLCGGGNGHQLSPHHSILTAYDCYRQRVLGCDDTEYSKL